MAKKTKLRDLGMQKSGTEIKERLQKASETGQKRFFKELRLKEKRANERMRQLELADINSPALQAVQAKLEMIGKQKKGDRGRRFSETGRATYAESEYLNKILDEFLGAKTSKLSQAKQYYEDMWQSANTNDQLSNAGITKEQWLDFWENMPDKKKDRMYYSQQVKIFKAFMRKNGKLIDEGKMTVADIAESIQNAETLSDALGKLNVTLQEVTKETYTKVSK